MSWFTDPEAWAALVTLTSMEIILGIDNIIFLTLIAGRLPEDQRDKARILGLLFAMVTRIILLLSITWIMRLETPFIHVGGHAFSGRDLILLVGGLFLLAKSTHEIHNANTEHSENSTAKKISTGITIALIQIALIDIVFSLDSVITAVGMADHVEVMIIAIVISVILMLFAAKHIGHFVETHPTIKMLALGFLLLIGVTLIADGLHFHIPKGYIYFAMVFSLIVECLNIRLRKKTQ